MIAASRAAFDKYHVNDRITLLEGPAQDSIAALTGTFDIIFVDANKDGYEDYVKIILDNKLLSERGLIVCDNVFARGLTFGEEGNSNLVAKRGYWLECGRALDHFNRWVRSDERVDVVLLPLFDGVTLISWKRD
jgi:predicted O-methyltransferase YrrM